MKPSNRIQIKAKRLLGHFIPNAGTLVLVALMLFAYSAWAAPHQATSAQETSSIFSYQGTLADANGDPVTGDVDMTFRLYTVATDGAALWEEVCSGTNAVPVDNGLFQVMLGAVNQIPNSIWENDPLYLGIQIGSDPEMTPRELVGKSPRAVVADRALTADIAAAAQTADVALSVPDGSISSDQLANHLCCGHTDAGGLGWQNYNDTGIYIHVDTSSCDFSSTPMYFTSLAGGSQHYTQVGATSIYGRSSTGFRVYLASRDGEHSPPTIAQADEQNWHIQWCGVEK